MTVYSTRKPPKNQVFKLLYAAKRFLEPVALSFEALLHFLQAFSVQTLKHLHQSFEALKNNISKIKSLPKTVATHSESFTNQKLKHVINLIKHKQNHYET